MSSSDSTEKAPRRSLRILWGCTGSVATVKVPQAVLQLRSRGHEVRVVATERGLTMLEGGAAARYDPGAFAASDLGGPDGAALRDADEWPSDFTVGRDAVLHIELRRWADVLVVAPASANTLAKLAAGLCDNLLTCVLRAWDPAKPVVVAPAMNTLMWEHPLTGRHLAAIQELGYVRVVPPVVKTLACKDTGVGAMASVDDIIDATEKACIDSAEGQ